MWGKARDLADQALGSDPCGAAPVERPTLTEADIQALSPAVRENVVEGGIRLARLLDDALGPQHKAPGAEALVIVAAPDSASAGAHAGQVQATHASRSRIGKLLRRTAALDWRGR